MMLLNNAGWPVFLLLFSLLMIVLYVARAPAHRAIEILFGAVSTSLRMLARAIGQTARTLQARNREVLLNIGREHETRELNREFNEISRFVQNDLGGYPQLQQQMRDQIAHIQENHESAQLAAHALPEWSEAAESLAKIKQTHAGPNTKVLEQIHTTAVSQHKEHLRAYNEANTKRYRALQALLPYWRKLSFSVDQTGDKLKDIVTRSEKIDTHMARFEEINEGSDKSLRFLHMSALTQFLISALVIAIAVGGAFFNFQLIALPMSEMVGSVQRIGGVKVSDLAAMVIICMEICAGIFLLESLRITKLFPMIGSMDRRTRRVIMFTSLGVLLTLACTESALAFMRDQIAGDLAALRATLSGSNEDIALTATGAQHWIPLTANMVLGFVLPIALTMIAIPLEYLLQSGRTVLGNLVAGLLGLLSTALRLVANAFKQTGKALVQVYDLVIAGPLYIESLVNARATQEADIKADETEWEEPQSLADTFVPKTARKAKKGA